MSDQRASSKRACSAFMAGNCAKELGQQSRGADIMVAELSAGLCGPLNSSVKRRERASLWLDLLVKRKRTEKMPPTIVVRSTPSGTRAYAICEIVAGIYIPGGCGKP